MAFQNFVEEIQVFGRDLVDKVKSLLHEGNVQRVIIKDDRGNTYLEIPVTVAAVGVLIAPMLAALGAISALVARFTIVVVRSEPSKPATSQSAAAPDPEPPAAEPAAEAHTAPVPPPDEHPPTSPDQPAGL